MSDDVSDADYWSRRYADDTAAWDLGGPCPVFVDWLARPEAPKSGRVAFPGCGRGHDLRFWLDAGLDAIGFDFADLVTDLPIQNLDVFALGKTHPAAFDMVVEYTCYCAIDPARRAEYVASVAQSLRPGGFVLALLFPMGPRDGGPPYGVLEHEIQTVWGAALDVVSVKTPTTSVESRLGRERLAVFRRPDDAL